MSTLIFVTCKNTVEARKIANALLKRKLVACANILPKIESHYWWKGKLEEASEALLVLKTRKGLQEQVSEEIRKAHSYKLPVIEFVEMKMSRKAEHWIEEETVKK